MNFQEILSNENEKIQAYRMAKEIVSVFLTILEVITINYDFIEEDEEIIEVSERGIEYLFSVVFGSLLTTFFFVSALMLILRIIFGSKGISGAFCRSINANPKDAIILIPLGVISLFLLLHIIENYFFYKVILTNKNIYIRKWFAFQRYNLQELDKINISNVKFCLMVIIFKSGEKFSISFIDETTADRIKRQSMIRSKALRE